MSEVGRLLGKGEKSQATSTATEPATRRSTLPSDAALIGCLSGVIAEVVGREDMVCGGTTEATIDGASLVAELSPDQSSDHDPGMPWFQAHLSEHS